MLFQSWYSLVKDKSPYLAHIVNPFNDTLIPLVHQLHLRSAPCKRMLSSCLTAEAVQPIYICDGCSPGMQLVGTLSKLELSYSLMS